MEAGAIPAQGRCCDSRMAGADATGMTGKALRPAAVGLRRDQSEYLPLLSAALGRRTFSSADLRSEGWAFGIPLERIPGKEPAAVRELFASGAFVFSGVSIGFRVLSFLLARYWRRAVCPSRPSALAKKEKPGF